METPHSSNTQEDQHVKQSHPFTSTANLIRWSGLLSIVSGICWALETLLHPPRNITTLAIDARVPRWELVHTIGLIGFALALFALMGCYLRQREQSGLLGLVGFVFLFLGVALGIGGYAADAYVFPVLATHSAYATLLVFSGPLLGGSIGTLLAVSAGFQLLGYLLFGIASLRVGILPRWGTWLLLIGFVLTNLPILDDILGMQLAFILSNLGAVMFGLGYIWWGWALWMRPSNPPQRI